MIPMMLTLALTLTPGSDRALDLAGSLATRAEMHERFTRATMIQTALINGELAAAQHWAGQLAAIAPEEREFADLRARFGFLALAVTRAESVAAAAGAAANLANACGACHELHDVRPDRFESTVGLPGGGRLADRMARHGWAADRLWEGLVGRSEQSWLAGAAALGEEPLTTEELGPEAADATPLAVEVTALGREALQTVRWKGRAEVYGRLLARCADCHASYRVPGPDGDR